MAFETRHESGFFCSLKIKSIIGNSFFEFNLKKKKEEGKMDDEKSLKEHFCVNSNACDICRKVFPVTQEVDEKKNIFQKKRDRRGTYFVQHITWQA